MVNNFSKIFNYKAFLAVLAFVFLCHCGSLSFAESEMIFEQHYLIKSKGVKTGFLHVSQRKKHLDNGMTAIVTQKHIEQQFKRLNDEMKIVQDQTFTEDENGIPLQFSYKSKNKSEDINLTGKIDWDAKQILVNSMVNGIKDSQVVDFDGKILFPYAVDRLYNETNKKKFKYSTLEPGINIQILNFRVERIKDDLIEVNGNVGEYVKYKTNVNIFSNTDIYEWRDKNGRLVKEYTSLLNTEQIAVKKDEIHDISSDFDIYSESFVRVNKAIPNPDEIEQAIYKITSADTLIGGTFIEDANQKIIQIKDNNVFLKVSADKYNDYRYSYPFKTEYLNEYLQSGAFIITDSPRIKSLANSLKSGETDALHLALKMRNWVYENIGKKTFELDFANSVKTLEEGSGDCTEHSILLASLLRAAGIPSKIVIGLTYTDEPENAFVYHMWVKAYVGKWVSLDPSLPYKNFTPLHLAMADSPLNTISEKAKIMMNVINSFSKLHIEILNMSKPVTAKISGKLEVKVNLNNRDLLSGNNFVDLKIKNSSGTIPKIMFPVEEVKSSIKDSFYNFTRGNTESALWELKEFYKTIAPDDDFMKIKLALKLINMSYFNFAEEVLEEVEDRAIWGNFISDLKYLHFPKKFFPDDKKNLQVAAFYALNYKNDADFTLELTQDINKYDYIYYLRAKAFMKKNEYEEAEKEIQKAIKINHDNLTYNLEFVKILSAKNEIYKAYDQLAQVNILAKKYKIQDKEFWKNFNTQDCWLKVKQFREDALLSKYYEARYYLTKGELDTAFGIINKLIYYNDEAYLYELMADMYYELDQFDAAQKYYHEAMALDKNRVKTLLGLGNISFLSGNTDKALEYYEKILSERPDNVDALLYMAKLQKYLRNDDKSYEYFKKILAIDKDNTDVLYNIGIILANRGEFEKSEKLLKKVISKDPMQPDVWLDLAKLKLSEGEAKDAVIYLTNVKYLDDKNPYYYYFMSLVLEKYPQESKKYLKKAIELKPDLANQL